MTRRLPMFPLGLVLMPTQPLPLHVFELRYRQLLHELTAPDAVGAQQIGERGRGARRRVRRRRGFQGNR